jgi:DNA-directed RNA polymerase specialized sigma24 family protein
MATGNDPQGSVTRWIEGLKGGDPEALDRIWSRYFERLAVLARRRLSASRRRAGADDEQDAALSALHSLWDRATGGRLPDLRGRDELWRLLVVITARKAAGQVARESRQKRGGGKILDEGALDPYGADVLAQFVGGEPTPEFVAMVAEEIARRLDDLVDPALRQVAVLRMEGYSNREIAERLGCALRTIERKLDVVRRFWGGGEAP